MGWISGIFVYFLIWWVVLFAVLPWGVQVPDIIAARDRLKAQGARVLGDGEPRIGAHGKPVLFLHPKDFCGTLIEIEQA